MRRGGKRNDSAGVKPVKRSKARTMNYPKFITAPALALIVLSPFIGELLSSSAPPEEFFRPRALLFLTLLYGGGALLVRELAVRWKGGWLMVLVLGAAYGMIEEGLLVKSFFDPGWSDLGILGAYGRWGGVNWVWALFLTAYHAVFSIAVPIMLAGLMFPARRGRPWIGRWLFWVTALLFPALVAVGFQQISAYRPPPVPYVVTVLLVAALMLLARGLRPAGEKPGGEPAPAVRHRWFGLAGFLSTFLFLANGMGLPHTGVHPLVTMTLMTGLVILVGAALRKMTRRGAGWTDRHKMALVSGALIFFISLTPFYEMPEARTDNPAGMMYVGLAMAVFLIWLSRRVRKRAVERDKAGV